MSETILRMRRDKRLNFGVRHAGFAYQLQAVEAVKNLPYAALFHEQGLGKTKIGIDLALAWLGEDVVDAIVFVTKRSLVQNWIDEIKSHAYISPKVLDQNHSSNFYALNSSAPIFLCHYEVIKSEERRLSMFLKTRRVGMILDESHKIKNPEAELSKAFHRLSPNVFRRAIMTGTPVANRPYDIWSQVFFLDQGAALGKDFDLFKENLDLTNDLWADDSKRSAFESEVASVFAKIKEFSVRETKATAGIELPEKKIGNIPVAMAHRQAQLYRQFQYDLQASIEVESELVIDDAEQILKRLLRLVQIASNPGLIDGSYDEVPGKVSALVEVVEAVVGRREKVIVWTSFVGNVEWLGEVLSSYGAVKVHGELGIDVRNEAIKAFKTVDSVRVLIATPGAAKEGLTLTVANNAIFFDRSFSLDDYLQAQDRIHRISQSQTCYVWNLISENSVDEWVDMLLMAKKLAAQLLQSDINADEYRQLANYDFGKLIRQVLSSELLENTDG